MNILERYGIKEVADVTFYKINDDGSPAYPVLYLDTLKVTTIEQTAEETEARGGKGNAALIAWDYGKSINVTIEDALFSAKSMAIMFGNGNVQTYNGSNAFIMKTEQFTATGTTMPTEGNSNSGWEAYFIGPDGKQKYLKINPKFYNANGEQVTSALIVNAPYFCSYDLKVDGAVIDISANTFPGTYYVTGDTFARSEATGDDEFFQFIIPKAKVQSENTITLEAEGDPSVFNMNLKVLRPADGVMMKLVKYDLTDGSNTEGLTSTIYHNHYLNEPTEVSGGLEVSENAELTIPKPVAAGDATVTWDCIESNKQNLFTTFEADANGDLNIAVATTAVSKDTNVIVIARWGEYGIATYNVLIKNN